MAGSCGDGTVLIGQKKISYGAELINRSDVRSTTAFVLGFATVFVLAFSYFFWLSVLADRLL